MSHRALAGAHTDAALLPELANESGLTADWTQAMLGSYKGQPVPAGSSPG